MTASTPSWLLLITNLPGHNPTLRMRTWRALKAGGAGLLRDGAYLLPNGERSRLLFQEQATDIREAGGAAHLLSFGAESREQNAAFQALFDRALDYREVVERLDEFKRELDKCTEPEARQRLAGVRREVSTIVARDFFPGEPRKQMEGALADAEAAVNTRFAADEPHSAPRAIQPRDREDYRSRIWATRERLWVDRVASAWLIRRVIDPKAKFLWLRSFKDCPKRAVGFDFDGAEFTHVDSRVTFEVLVASFELGHDIGLVKLGALVHHLDVGGIPVAEAPGLATIMAGARAVQPDDDALLKAMTSVLDSLYAGYASADDKK
jgi:hypothetical protein